MNIDHIVLWVSDVNRSLDFYIGVMGLAPVRTKEFEAGDAGFPSVRLNEQTIIDLMQVSSAASTAEFTGGADDSAGNPVNHVCLAMDEDEFKSLMARLDANNVMLTEGSEASFGAQGAASRSIYFNDPDRNVIEIRWYAETA